MFREMRRFKQALTDDEIAAVLERGTSGVLAVLGDDGYPYAVPVSYVWCDGKFYFHSATAGHKLDAIAHDNRVSFCVIDQDVVSAEHFTSYYRSVIAFGRARIIEDEAEKRATMAALAARYFPDDEPGRVHEIDKSLHRMSMIELTVESITGKEANELRAAKS